MSDRIVRALSASGGIRVLACSAAELTRVVCDLQEASATASIALARGLAGGALMGALLKDDQRVALKFEGNGPLLRLLVEAESDGAVRASAGNPAAEAEPLNGHWNVAGLLGRAGFLTVSKDLGHGGEPYRGMVQLHSSEIGEDLAYYLTDSEQTPSAVGLGASLDQTGLISTCGGFLLQALPGAQEDEIEAFLASIASLPPLSSLLAEGGPELILEKLFDSRTYKLLESRDIFFRCGCSREKVEQALATFGAEELRDMATRDKGAQATCEFCRKTYRIDAAELERLASQSTSGSTE